MQHDEFCGLVVTFALLESIVMVTSVFYFGVIDARWHIEPKIEQKDLSIDL